MTGRLVVGLFPSSGIALDAYHRLRTEGVAASRLAHRVLKEIAPVPPPVAAELQGLAVDPLVLGDVRHTFARFIRNGETAVFVRAEDDGAAQFAADILKLYAPLAIETVPRHETSGRPG
jgi:non-ribosomal peptide synthetase component F